MEIHSGPRKPEMLVPLFNDLWGCWVPIISDLQPASLSLPSFMNGGLGAAISLCGDLLRTFPNPFSLSTADLQSTLATGFFFLGAERKLLKRSWLSC